MVPGVVDDVRADAVGDPLQLSRLSDEALSRPHSENLGALLVQSKPKQLYLMAFQGVGEIV